MKLLINIVFLSLGLTTIASNAVPLVNTISDTELENVRIKNVSAYVYKDLYPYVLKAFKNNPYTSFVKYKVRHLDKGFYITDEKGSVKRVYASYIVPPHLLTYIDKKGSLNLIKDSRCYKPSKYSEGITDCLTNDEYKNEASAIKNPMNFMFSPRYMRGEKVLGSHYLSLNKTYLSIYKEQLLPIIGYRFSL